MIKLVRKKEFYERKKKKKNRKMKKQHLKEEKGIIKGKLIKLKINSRVA